MNETAGDGGSGLGIGAQPGGRVPSAAKLLGGAAFKPGFSGGGRRECWAETTRGAAVNVESRPGRRDAGTPVVYLAARYSRREELCRYKTDLEAAGYQVPARWLLGEHQVHGLEAARAVEADGPVPAEQAVLFAEDDIEDLLGADIIVNFTEAPRSGATRGGRHVELGVALGLKRVGAGRHDIYVVGPLENVFHALPEIDGRFDTWEQCLEHLREVKDEITEPECWRGTNHQGDHRPVDGDACQAWCTICAQYCHRGDDPRQWCNGCELAHLRDVVEAWRVACKVGDTHDEDCSLALSLQHRAYVLMETRRPPIYADVPCDCSEWENGLS
ncbi:MAG: hypothetical protein ACYCS4_07885 [Acidimicrobiales bacterium]